MRIYSGISFEKPSDLGYDAEGGSELRSRFWFGWQIIEGKPVKCIPDGFKIPTAGPASLLNHNVKEFSNLARILPDLYSEEKDHWL